ncbi:hypothetical protein GGR52DRAFT_561377 [Hypoxylon sp. FL1284]|nr:hypothetical protein GGR52DRAFT_561377 [Hypoxylon sp. FL1284]
MSATDDRRQILPHASLDSGAHALASKCSTTTPPIRHDNDKSTLLLVAPNDSGYASLVSTSKKEEGNCPPPPSPPSSPKVIFKPIPEDLKNRFLDFKILHKEALLKAVSGKRNKNVGDISMKLRYRGETEADTQLYIIVQCESRTLRKVKRFFDKSDVKETLGSDFRVHFINAALVRLLSSETPTVCAFPESIQETTCGTVIDINLNGIPTRATIGGLIIVSNSHGRRIYGLTAGHPLASLYADEFSGYSSESSDGSSPDVSEDDESYEQFQPPKSKEASDSAVYNAGRPKTQIGTVVADSFHSQKGAGNHDWALVEINPEYCKPNLLCASEVDRPETWLPLSVPHSHSTFRSLTRRNTAIITYRGVQRGTLSSNHSSLLMSPSNGFLDTLDYIPAPGSTLMAGDSGAWVVDEQTGSVYGHVVAVDGLGEAHVMPILSTMEDIKIQLKEEKAIPSRKVEVNPDAIHKSHEPGGNTLEPNRAIREAQDMKPMEWESVQQIEV